MDDLLVAEFEARVGIADFLESLGAFNELHQLGDRGESYKAAIRQLHRPQRVDRTKKSAKFLTENFEALAPYFAGGKDVNPKGIVPRLELVSSGTREADLFRLASLTWSVPVSEGYGRRMRFLVWDENNGKVIGIFALGDPVFNLAARDKSIGWSSAERGEKLVNVMDAYVLGAVPPYSHLLGGKMIACLIRTREVRDLFLARYGATEGVISRRSKQPQLLAVTTTSSLGRSSIYNRLALDGMKYFSPLGYTSGFGHFHITSQLFEVLRKYLESVGHPYASGNRYGNGPNWKFRAIRVAFESLGISRDILQHGIQREVFICHVAKNANEALKNSEVVPDYSDLRDAKEVSDLAIERWIVPRSRRFPGFRSWRPEQMFEHIPH